MAAVAVRRAPGESSRGASRSRCPTTVVSLVARFGALASVAVVGPYLALKAAFTIRPGGVVAPTLAGSGGSNVTAGRGPMPPGRLLRLAQLRGRRAARAKGPRVAPAASMTNPAASAEPDFGQLYVVEPPGAQHDATVIWLHGLGDTGMGWADVGPQLQQRLQKAKFIFPTAPTVPVTVNMGMSMPSWFDINSLDPTLFSLDPPGLGESAAYVRKLVQAEVDAGIAPERIVLAGFSQGGAVVLSAALDGAVSVGAVLVLSSFLGSKLGADHLRPPVHFFHGDADGVVPAYWGRESYDAVRGMGISATFRSYSGMAHSACPEELGDILQVLVGVLG